jgi:tryptophan 2,3-dioxygenase
MSNSKNVYYADYLALDKILNAQSLLSEKHGKPAHDEMLFIIIHQTYELWFKQILFELESVLEIFLEEPLPSQKLKIIDSRLNRINEILKILVSQIQIIETMSSLDFLDFRDLLIPASGFQSVQFRLLETRLGLTSEYRLSVEKNFFNSRLKREDIEKIYIAEKKPSLFFVLESWLKRMPFDEDKKNQFNFWEEYKAQVYQMLKQDEESIKNNKTLSEEIKNLELKNLEFTRKTFLALFDKTEYDKLLESKQVRLNHKALRSLVFIYLYSDLPALQLPYKIIQEVIEIDERLTEWRYRHAIMAHRILGTKIGTGGSSGHDYLKKTAEMNRIFKDFFNVATFLIPKSKVPKLPDSILNKLNFNYEIL